MSFFSGLEVFYPGRPPRMSVSDLRRFCDGLRALLELRDNSLLRVELQYGNNEAAAFDSVHEVTWDESGLVGLLPLEEDRQSERLNHEAHNRDWNALWPTAVFDGKPVVRASIHLGGLPKSASADLTAMQQPDDLGSRAYVAPDGLSVHISPIYAMTLGTEPPEDEDICYGFFGLTFSGNGYFTWQPLEDYWRSVERTETMRKTLEFCQTTWPVPDLTGLETLKDALQERLLNQEEYQGGDWIVSVSETG